MGYSDLGDLLTRVPFLGQTSVAGQRVLLRADLNVPLDEYGEMVDDGRLRAALPTINHLLDHGAAVIVASHRRKSTTEETGAVLSLSPLARRLSRIWEVEIQFSGDAAGPESRRLAGELKPGQVLLLENLRFDPGEEAADPGFAKRLADLADIYVNDAFGVCHRPHASMVLAPQLFERRLAGLALKGELLALARTLNEPARPMAAIIGGRDVEAKLPVLAKLMDGADYVFLGGRIGDTFSRLMFNGGSKNLPVADEALTEIRRLIGEYQAGRLAARLFVPVDAVVESGGEVRTCPIQDLLSGPDRASDIGPATRLLYREALNRCRTIVWSGPVGIFERRAFAAGTDFIVRTLSECQGVTLAGGADTLAAILKSANRRQFSFLSTGGSAFLEALAGRPLIALKALLESKTRC